VSGSSGHLVIDRQCPIEEQKTWPGQVLSASELSYEEAMGEYLQATQDRQQRAWEPKDLSIQAPTRWRQEWEGRAARHHVLQQRKQEDAKWKTAKTRYRTAKLAYGHLPKAQRVVQQSAWLLETDAWQQLRHERQGQHQTRQQENEVWHGRNQHLKADPLVAPQTRTWIAILVVTDNCTRQSRGLPLFRTGAKVTSQEVLAALKCLLPAELQFVISDQGKHFRTQWMLQLAQDADFAHVLIYRHRPQSNGIAERFVLTFKDWLRSHAWASADQLEILLPVFEQAYNDRPHQGLAIPGLSPNEFAKRIWLM
jgi:transposase InsO family protein